MKPITKGKPIPKPGVPESFRVLVKELQSLGLDMRVLTKMTKKWNFVTSMKGMDDDGSTDDLEKNVKKQHKEAKAAFDAEESENNL